MRSSRPLPWVRVFLLTATLLWGMTLLWSLATPMFGGPDENAHALKAVVGVRGQNLGKVEPSARYPVYSLPDGYRFPPGMMCFAHHPSQPADCGADVGDPTGATTFSDWVSSYNPAYYDVIGLPSLVVGGPTGVYAMRAVSGLLCSVLLAAAFTIGVGARRARWMPAGLVFLASPMVLFLASVISPQGMEIAAGVLLAVSLLRLLQRRDSAEDVDFGTTGLWVAVVIAASLLAIARALGPLWIVVIVATVFTVHGWRRSVQLFRVRRSYIGIGIVALIGVFSLGWTAFTGTLSGQAQAGDAPLVGASPISGAWSMLRETPFFLESASGIFGWQDTFLPATVYALYFGALAVLFASAVGAAAGADRTRMGALFAGAILVPVIVQAASVSRSGIIWQGRYALFLYLAVIVMAAVVLSRSPRADFLAMPIGTIIGVLVAVYGVAAFALALRRNVVGSGGTVTRMIHSPDWQPPLGWIALLSLMVLASVALVAGHLAITRFAIRRDRALLDA